MSLHTSFQIGGPADVFATVSDERSLRGVLKLCKEAGAPVYVIGNGSDLLIPDQGLRGVVVGFGGDLCRLRLENEITIVCGPGATLAKLCKFALENSLTGLEFAWGIPGSAGGAAYMNAGAYGGQISDVLLDARVLLDGEIQTLSQAEMEMGYRTTLPLKRGGIVLAARFALQKGDPEAIAARMKALNARRRDKQPLNFPSAGSVFKRPEGFFAGALIEEAGLKGRTVGGAQVSEKHAGFIINIGGATAKDVLRLIGEVQEAVSVRFGISLETEVRVIGEE